MAIVSLFAPVASASAQIPCAYEVADSFTTPSNSSPQPTAISPNGEYVVGYYYWFGGDERGFVYRTATDQFSTLPMPPGIISLRALDVSDQGKIAGTMGGIAVGDFGFIYNLNTGQFETQIPPLMPGEAVISAINSSGWACGWRTISEPLQNVISAFVWSPKDGLIDLGIMTGPRSAALDITNNNIVVGWTGDGVITTGTRAFVWQDSQSTILDAIPGGLSSAALSANDISQVLLRGRLEPQPGSPTRAYLWQNGKMIDIGVLPGCYSSVAQSINNSSMVEGICTYPNQNPAPDGFVWHEGTLLVLSDLIANKAGLSVFLPIRINDAGQILGFAGPLINMVIVLSPMDRAPGDSNCDQVINMDDLLQVINSWGPCEGCTTDFTGEGIVNLDDLMIVLRSWTF